MKSAFLFGKELSGLALRPRVAVDHQAEMYSMDGGFGLGVFQRMYKNETTCVSGVVHMEANKNHRIVA
jgi:hypothetical protein